MQLQEAIEKLLAPQRAIEKALAPHRELERLCATSLGLRTASPKRKSQKSELTFGISDEQASINEKTQIEIARTKFEVQRLVGLSEVGTYVGVDRARTKLKLGFGDPVDDRAQWRTTKAGGEWIIHWKTYGVRESEERKLHKQLGQRHELVQPGKEGSKEIYWLTPELVADLRIARVLDDKVKDNDFFQATIF